MSISTNPGVSSRGDSLCVIDISQVVRPFPFVNFGNYFLLLTGIYGLVAMLGFASATSLGIYEAATAVLASTVLAFCAWVGWRNIGVLGAVMHGYTIAAFLAFATLCSLLSAVYVAQLQKLPSFDSEEGKVAFIYAFYYGFLAVVALCAVAAIAILKRLSIKALGISLRDCLNRALIEEDTEGEYRLPPSKPKLGAFYLALGIVWLLGIHLIPDRFFLSSTNAIRIVNQISQVGFVFLIYARQYFQPDFKTLREADKRPPVLLLRSFKDDEKIKYQSADGSLLDFSLESRLAGHFSAIGPFIAVGEPKDKLPHLGAIRVQLSDDEWQGSVTNWMDESRLIVLMAGQTKWVGWELQEIVNRGHASKFVLLFPQIKVRFWKRGGRNADAAERLRVLCTAFRGTIWESGLLQLQEQHKPGRIRSVAFNPNGYVIATTSKPKNRESYHLAALVAHNFVQSWQGKGTAVARAKEDAFAEAVKNLAGLPARSFAAILDAILIVTVYSAATYKLPENVPHILRVGILAVLGIAYYFFCEALTGTTVGKTIVGIEVRAKGGERCNALGALTRNIFRTVDAIGVYLVGFLLANSSRLRQRLGDRLAGTLVVKKHRSVFLRVLVGAVWIAFFCIGVSRVVESAPPLSEITDPMTPLPAKIPVTSTGHLRVGNFNFVETRKGPPRSTNYKPGETVTITYDIAGSKIDDQGIADVKIELTVRDPDGLLVTEPQLSEFHQSIGRTNRINGWLGVVLPEYVPQGNYHIDAKVHDVVANKDLEFQPVFKVDTPSEATAQGLAIENLRLALSSDGPPETHPVLHGAGKVYMSCSVIGLQFVNDYRKVKMALTVIGPDGNTVLDNPNSLSMDDKVFYHPATYRIYLTDDLSIPDKFPPGTYVEKYTVTDGISGRTAVGTVAFDVQ